MALLVLAVVLSANRAGNPILAASLILSLGLWPLSIFRHQRDLFWALMLVLLQILFAYAVTLYSECHAYVDAVLPGNVDQEMYLAQGGAIAEATRHISIWVLKYSDYSQFSARSYQYTVAALMRFTDSHDPLWIRIFNFHMLWIASWGCVKSIGALLKKPYPAWTAWPLLMMPSTNLYAILVLRENLMTACLAVFTFSFLSGNIFLMLSTLFVLFYSRVPMVAIVMIYALLFVALKWAYSEKSSPRWKLPAVFALISGFCFLFFSGMLTDPLRKHLASLFFYMPSYEFKMIRSFTLRFIPAFSGTEFAFASPYQWNENYSLTRAFLVRLVQFDSVLMPAALLACCYGSLKFHRDRVTAFALATLFIFVLYVYSYVALYAQTFIRLYVPWYPIFMIVVLVCLIRRRQPLVENL
ncbi:MAG: hypothetical protein ABIR96_09790 [Bdellovibrionota bacterium]